MSNERSPTFIGTAAWTIPLEAADRFRSDGSHLERYARELRAVEINTSFYREHKPATYERWRDAVPDDFKFSVKLSKLFTHERRLENPGAELRESLRGVMTFGPKLGVLLVQLPASLTFSLSPSKKFFASMRATYDGPIAIEPRNVTWTSPAALKLLRDFRIAKVLADPEPCPLSKSARLSLESDLRYFRLHGTPQRYKSSYDPERIERIARAISASEESTRETWCIFDNTTFGFATLNALDLVEKIGASPSRDEFRDPSL